MRVKSAAKPLIALLLSAALLAGCQSVQPPSVSEPQGTVDPPAATTNEPAPQTNKETPRNETLYVNGLQWGPPTNFNLLSGNPAFPVNYGNSRELLYET
jgi:peptide/nickel transport system substrate-binding protein